jgi:arylsulfatase
MLFSGKDNHSAGMGNMRNLLRPEQKGKPGYEGILPLDVLPFQQVLQDNGYHTMMVGKWHMGGDEEGEEAYYAYNRGFTETRDLLLPGGDMSYMSDKDGNFISERDSKEMHGRKSFYNDNGKESDFSKIAPNTQATVHYTDKAIEMMEHRDHNKPFYLNMSYIAPHAPWGAPKKVIDQYAPVYAVGWGKIRQQRFDNLKKLGYLPASTTLPAMPKGVPAWTSLSKREKLFEARRMAVYTADIDVLDQNIGRLIKYLKKTHAYENTVFIVYSDNGGALQGEGHPPAGVVNYDQYKGKLDTLDKSEFTKVMNAMGGPKSWVGPNMAWGTVANVPFSGYKGDTKEGGVRGAAFLHYAKAKETLSGVTYNCLQSVMDVAPTILEMAGLEYPTTYKGKPTTPMQGTSMANLFKGKLYCNPERWIGFELNGIKGIRQGNWRLSEGWGVPIVGLYNVADDPFERHDLSKENPSKYKAMLDIYHQYATINHVIEVENK